MLEGVDLRPCHLQRDLGRNAVAYGLLRGELGRDLQSRGVIQLRGRGNGLVAKPTTPDDQTEDKASSS